MRCAAFLAVCLLFLFTSFARAEFYRWVDRDGNEFYTNEREQVPQEYQGTAAVVRPEESRVSLGDNVVATGKPSAPLAEHKDKYGRGEKYWHKRAVKLRKELATLQIKYDLLLKKEAEDEDKLMMLIGGSSRNTIIKAQARRAKRKSKLEKSLAQIKYALEVVLPDEARRSEAYPGWLRE